MQNPLELLTVLAVYTEHSVVEYLGIFVMASAGESSKYQQVFVCGGSRRKGMLVHGPMF